MIKEWFNHIHKIYDLERTNEVLLKKIQNLEEKCLYEKLQYEKELEELKNRNKEELKRYVSYFGKKKQIFRRFSGPFSGEKATEYYNKIRENLENSKALIFTDQCFSDNECNWIVNFWYQMPNNEEIIENG